jgi:hypothetical protein
LKRPSFCEVVFEIERGIMKLIFLVFVGALVLDSKGQGMEIGMPDLLSATLVRILSTRDPEVYGQNRAQTLTVVDTGQTVEKVLRALAPKLTYTFYTLSEEEMSRVDPRPYWTQALLVVLEETVSFNIYDGSTDSHSQFSRSSF